MERYGVLNYTLGITCLNYGTLVPEAPRECPAPPLVPTTNHPLHTSLQNIPSTSYLKALTTQRIVY